jgi:hypothetical protein
MTTIFRPKSTPASGIALRVTLQRRPYLLNPIMRPSPAVKLIQVVALARRYR